MVLALTPLTSMSASFPLKHIVEGDRGAGARENRGQEGYGRQGEERAGGRISTMAGSGREIQKDKLLLFVTAYFHSKKQTQERFLTSI